ncbi:MAG: TlpA family protein disulfide reductase [Cytophagales bacterium]|nr:TlpA family protein disulfide reductase [Cytophagales bacterium]
MKILRLLIPAFALLLFLSCSTEPSIDYALFSGTIENPAGNKLTVLGSDFEQEIAVADDGTFSDTLRLEAGYYTFSHAERSSLYLAPGHNISMAINTEEFDETIKYTGLGSEINNYMAGKVLKQEELIPDSKAHYLSEETDYVAKTEELKLAYLEMLEGVKEADAFFYDLEKRNVKYDNLSSLTAYEGGHIYYAAEPDFKASEGLLDPIKELDYDNDEDYRYFSSYRDLVSDKYIDYYAIVGNPDTISQVLDNIKALKSENIKNGLMKSFKYYISPAFDQLGSLYEGIMEISTDDEYKAEVTEKYDVVKKLVKGKPAPKFAYASHDDKQVSLDDLKGKIVYIDVWATWCGPCLREVPFLKEVEAAYEGTNVQFVSISIDQQKDFEKWKKMIVDKKLGGLQLFAEGDWSSKLADDYAIDSIPRFLLIDGDGNIVSADAPRPRDPELREMLDGLI